MRNTDSQSWHGSWGELSIEYNLSKQAIQLMYIRYIYAAKTIPIQDLRGTMIDVSYSRINSISAGNLYDEPVYSDCRLLSSIMLLALFVSIVRSSTLVHW